jgi:hypothetical protein
MIARVTGGTRRKIIHADVRGPPCLGTTLLTEACIFAFRQSAHSVAVCDPIENPLNDFPQLGQMGTLAIPFNAHGYQFNNVINKASGMYHSVNHPVMNSSRECYVNYYCGF